jgi:hypothetical protein
VRLPVFDHSIFGFNVRKISTIFPTFTVSGVATTSRLAQATW